jgi:hypothetical protein
MLAGDRSDADIEEFFTWLRGGSSILDAGEAALGRLTE